MPNSPVTAMHPKVCAALLGRAAPTRHVRIEAGQLRLFAKATGETNPAYLDETAARAAGYPALPAPPTFAFCVERLAADRFNWIEQIGLPIRAMLHVEQSFEYHAPLYAGDLVTLSSRVVDVAVRAAGALELVIIETELFNQHDQLCVRQRFSIAVLVNRIAA